MRARLTPDGRDDWTFDLHLTMRFSDGRVQNFLWRNVRLDNTNPERVLALDPARVSGNRASAQAFRAVRELVDAGIRAGVLMNPIVPGITSKPAMLERTVKAIADHGARFVGCNVMFLEGGTRDHFMKWLAQEFPNLVDGYAQLYAGKYAPPAYRQEVGNVIGMLRQKYGVNRRGEDGADPAGAESAPRAAEQQMLTFKERR